MTVQVRRADLEDPDDASAIVAMTDAYARDPTGGGEPLPAEVEDELVPAMREHGNVVVWLAERDGTPLGILTGIVKFSTFAASSTLNVHDVAVLAGHRGQGIGRQLLDAAERWARKEGLARMSLEVLDDNPARRLYERVGFEDKARYMVKPLDEAGDSYAGDR
jgi:GNAT superfamily N-acetyltransferase